MTTIQWDYDQQQALDSVASWHRSGATPLYRLFGYAGSGKTTLAKHFADGIEGTVIYGAFTGKAASVLRKKGCSDATTIHKLIYCVQEKSRERLRQMTAEMDDLRDELTKRGMTPELIDRDPGVIALRDEITDEGHKLKRPSWKLNPDSPIRAASLVVIDEVSMVDRRIGEDLLSFGVPLLVLGDPAQLPPVMGEGFFTNGRPDTLLTAIHRQARDNPILQLAHMVRQKQELRPGQYGTSKVILKAQVDRAELLAADQVIVGKNKTRKAFNARVRTLLGREHPEPIKGDKLICLRNNHEIGLLNGSMWKVNESSVSPDNDKLELCITPEDEGSEVCTTVHKAYFYGEEPKFYEMKDAESFDYGYAITGHKSQGSQWNDVYIFDESFAFRQDAHRWLYTAITRAAEKTTIVM